MSFFDDSDDSVVRLIGVDAEGKFFLDETAREILHNLDKNVSVVSCAGKYRTGKSYLLNRLVDTRDGFAVGDSIQACTKGLWMYSSPVHETETDCILVVDTEGIGAMDAADSRDVQIFTMALLLSSMFLYNSMGAIDEAALQTLSLMVDVTEFVRVGDGSNLSDHMPHFVWVLRDFALKLVSKDGKPCSRAEYLHTALSDMDGVGAERCRVRHAIRDAFDKRDLVTMRRPAEGKGFHQRCPRFEEDMRSLRKFIQENAKPVRVNGHPVDGCAYAALCQALCTMLNSPGSVPVIRDTWSMVKESRANKLREEVVAKLQGMNQDEAESAEAFQSRVAAEKSSLLKEVDADKIVGACGDSRRSVETALDAAADSLVSASVAREDTRVQKVASHALNTLACAEVGEVALLKSAVQAFSATKETVRLAAREFVGILISKLDETRRFYVDQEARLASQESEIASARLDLKAMDERRSAEVAEAAEKSAGDVRQLRSDLEYERQRGRQAADDEQKRMSELRAHVMEEAARASESNAPICAESGEACPESDWERELNEVRSRIEQNARAASEAAASLRSVEEEKAALAEQVEVLSGRIEGLQSKYKLDLQAIRHKHDADAKARGEAHERDKDRIRALQAEMGDMEASLSRSKHDVSELRQVVVEQKRISHEKALAFRALSEDVQLRLLNAHKMAIDEMRQKDDDRRILHNEYHADMLKAHAEHVVTLKQMEQQKHDNSCLKRQLLDQSILDATCKREKLASTDAESRAMTYQLDNQYLRGKLDEVVADRNQVRKKLIEAEHALADANMKNHILG